MKTLSKSSSVLRFLTFRRSTSLSIFSQNLDSSTSQTPLQQRKFSFISRRFSCGSSAHLVERKEALYASRKEKEKMSGLRIQNTLSQGGAPQAFEPIEQGKISWYSCGPTVYDHSHLGHARNYVSQDILRRILIHYFGYQVKFVQNITDVDDKIILRARQGHLLDVEIRKNASAEDTLKLALDAFAAYAKKNTPLMELELLTPDNYAQRRDAAYKNLLAKTGRIEDGEAKTKMHIANLDAAVAAMKANTALSHTAVLTNTVQANTIFDGAADILLPYLDSLYKETVDAKDHSIFTKVTKYWENDFTEDMDALNVLRPDVITRVTEYVPQIVSYVEKIVEKGMAYEVDGSVYFSIEAFEAGGQTYAKCRPDSKNDQALLADGEGSLSATGTKKSSGDFALWKKSKPGEPSWPSPWGEGRPGWHIECSVMASDILGSRMDIHSGGVDLAFPHHDNELAQSEAYYCENGHPHQWVNYFLHTGHLSISGSKMSKSLKNFQTIKNALQEWTPRSLRIVFLMGRWSDGVEISPDMRTQAKVWEETVSNFFVNTKSLILDNNDLDNAANGLSLNDNTNDSLKKSLDVAKEGVKAALQDSFDTPKTLQIIAQLIRETNVTIAAQKFNIKDLETTARWITQMVGIYGLDGNASPPYTGLGWSSVSNAVIDPKEAVAPYKAVYDNLVAQTKDMKIDLAYKNVDADFTNAVSTGVSDVETLAIPYIRQISKIRDQLRVLATTSSSKSEILSLCDRIRDVDLTNLGVYLDDRANNQPSLIKFIPAAELIAAREEAVAKRAAVQKAKEAARVAKEKAEEERKEKAKIDPSQMFRGDQKYEAWDDEGLPTKLKGGEDVPKTQGKKLKKEWEKQKKLFDEYNKAQ